ncbi:MAG: hypothetical protein R3F60_08260 [bacterium]
MRLLLVLAGALAGCQLIIGEIELPQVERPEVGADAAPASDAAVADAVAPDATPTLDAAGMVDAGWDAARPVDAAPPVDAAVPDAAWLDASPPDAGPAVDVATLAGEWHVYGLQGRERAVTLFTAALRVAEDGSAIVTAIGSEEPLTDGPTPFMAHPDGSPRLAVNLFPVAGLMVGALDPVTGLGVLVNDQDRMSTQPIFALLSRQGPDQPWPAGALYAHLVVRPAPGGGELGVLAGPGADSTWTQSRRVDVEASASLADATLFREVTGGRTAFSSMDGRGNFIFSAADRGVGGPGVLFAGGDTYGLGLAVLAGGRPDRAGRSYFCGGPYFDVANAFAVSRSGARLSGAATPVLTWMDGREATLGAQQGGVYPLDTQRGFFHRPGGSVAMGPGGRVLMLVDGDLQGGQGRWALGLCVTVDP